MRHTLLLLTVLTCVETARADTPFAGTWEIQSMGADRVVTIEQKGRRITAHRVMWPEFEGETYKLEHLYRGTLNGNTIVGDLFVREEELPEYEALRTFTARVEGPNRMIWDGLPIERVSAKSRTGASWPAAEKQAVATAFRAPRPVAAECVQGYGRASPSR